MPYNFPKIEITDDAKAWLGAIYTKFKTREKAGHRSLKIELLGKIPDDFNPYQIDRRLLEGEDRLTLLGIWHLDPETDLIEKTHKVILLIKDFLFKNPELREISSEEISTQSGIDKYEVEVILRFISGLGSFTSTSYSLTNYGGIAKFALDGNEVFDEYIKYRDIEQLIINHQRESSPKVRPVANPLGYSAEDNSSSNKPHPIFRTKIEQIDPRLCFVLMPFKKEWSDHVYKELIRENVEALGFQCLRADNLNGPIIIEDIWTKINQCAIIVADLTAKNPNVLYEVGIVHAIGKPAILLTQDISDIPFDFKHLRHYEYQDNSEGFREFTSNFPLIFKDVYKQYYGENI